jgi:hypothetical protein
MLLKSRSQHYPSTIFSGMKRGLFDCRLDYDMSQTIAFGSKQAADAFREDHDEWLCPVDDDKRKKTVAVVSDAPDHIVERAELAAASGRSERSGDGGQIPLTDSERDRIEFSEGRASVPHARSVKGLARSEGVDDWLAYYDAQLTVDEHREVMERAAQEGGGRRLDEDRSADDRLGDAEAAMGGQCDHARGHCEHGDPDACEFLIEACGMDEDDVQLLLSDYQSENELLSYEELEGELKGALGRAWAGYSVAVKRLPSLLEEVRQEFEHAEQAAAAIYAIEKPLTDKGTEDFEALASHHERLRDLADDHADRLHGQPDDDDLDGDPDGEVFVDDRDDDQEDGPTEFEEQSREFRVAQNDGYLRESSEEKEASDRDGLGQYGAAPSDTQRLSDLGDDE